MKWNIQDNLKFKIQNSKLDSKTLIDILLENRGIKTHKEREEFLHPKLEDVTSDTVGIAQKQLKKALARIKKAIDDKENIVIFGDYDVDGITGTAILWETLHSLSAKVMPYIPNRMTEGYGLSITSLESLMEKIPETKLIITVDNGIVAHKAVEYANKKGIDVIITDHHVPHGEEKLIYPKAHAIVHTTKLCGAGVAWLLSQQFKNQNSKFKIEEDTHLELATLGTIADLVPLVGANRTIVKFGLNALKKTKRFGLLALFQEAALDRESLGVYEVGHVIAPRLNAAGRLTSAMDSLRLLCTPRQERASELAALLGLTNKERQQILKDATTHATNRIRNQESGINRLLFIADESYQQGIIGLVAGRLVEEFYRPSIVISKGEKISKASVRSVSGFNIIQFLRLASDLLVDVGGHPMAAGFTVETHRIEELEIALHKMSEEHVLESHLERSLRIDCALPIDLVSEELYATLHELSPFGMGNPEPTFISKNVKVLNARTIGKENDHIKFRLKGEGTRGKEYDGIGFRIGNRIGELKDGSSIDIVYTIDINEWKGRRILQLKIKDFKER